MLASPLCLNALTLFPSLCFLICQLQKIIPARQLPRRTRAVRLVGQSVTSPKTEALLLPAHTRGGTSLACERGQGFVTGRGDKPTTNTLTGSVLEQSGVLPLQDGSSETPRWGLKRHTQPHARGRNVHQGCLLPGPPPVCPEGPMGRYNKQMTEYAGEGPECPRDVSGSPLYQGRLRSAHKREGRSWHMLCTVAGEDETAS